MKLNPQTGFADWNQDFPNPVDFYLLLDGKAILPTNNENFGQINDPYINSQVAKLGTVPTTQLELGRGAVAVARAVRRQEGVRRACSATRRSRSSPLTGSTTRRRCIERRSTDGTGRSFATEVICTSGGPGQQ